MTSLEFQSMKKRREAIETTEENCVVSHSDSVDCFSTLAKMSEHTSSKLDKTTAIGSENDDSIPFGSSNNELISEAPITKLDNNAEKSDVISCNASMDSSSFETQLKKQGSPPLDKTTSRGEENDLLSCYSSNNDSISEEQISKLVSSPENKMALPAEQNDVMICTDSMNSSNSKAIKIKWIRKVKNLMSTINPLFTTTEIGDTNDSISDVPFKKCDGSPESHTTTKAEISDLVLCSVSSSEKLLGNERSLKSTTTTDKENYVISCSVSMDSSSSVTVGNKNKVKHDSSSEAEIQKLDDPREIDEKNYTIPSNISMDSSSCVNQAGKQGTPQTDETTSISEESDAVKDDVRLCNGSMDCSISISSMLDETNNTSSKDDLIISCPSNITVNTETQMSQWDHNQENKMTIVAEKNDVMVCSGSMDSSSSELIKREAPQTNYTSMIVGENNVPCSMGGSSPEVVKRKRARPPKNNMPMIGSKDDVPCSSSMDSSSPEVVKRKRGRPPKNKTTVIGSMNDVVPCYSIEDSSTSQLINRKRGMLPKTKIPTSDEKIDLTPGSGPIDSSSTEFVKRKRGKPPKNKMPMIGSEDDVPCSSSMDSSSPEVVKRKRGRPPKNKTTVIGSKNDVVPCYSIEDSCTSQLINRKRGMLPKTKIPTSDEKIDLTPGSGLTDSSSTEFVKRKRGKPPKNKNVKTSSNEHSESPSYIKEASNFNDLKISQQSMKFLKSINPTSNGAFLYKSVTRASSVNLAGDSSSTNLPSTSRAHVTKTECSIQVANTVVNFNPVVKLVNCMLDPSVSQSIILSRSMQTSKNKNVCIPDEQILTVSSSPIKHRNGDMNSISDDSPSTSSNVRINTHFDDHLKSSSRKTRGLSPESSVKQKREMRGTPGAKTSTSGPKVSSKVKHDSSSEAEIQKLDDPREIDEKNYTIPSNISMDSSSCVNQAGKQGTPQTDETTSISEESDAVKDDVRLCNGSMDCSISISSMLDETNNTSSKDDLIISCPSNITVNTETQMSQWDHNQENKMTIVAEKNDVMVCSGSMDSSSSELIKREAPQTNYTSMIVGENNVPCSMGGSSPEVVKRKRARPPKNNMPMIGSKDDVPCSSSMDSSSPEVVKRKRGRPPKNKTTVIGSMNDVVPCYSIEDSSTSQLINRKRGMLPKTKIPTSDEKIDLTPGSGPIDSSSTEFVKRKRGKPPKNKMPMIGSEDDVPCSSSMDSSSPEVVKRKRGRPPKNKTTVIGSKNDVVPCYSIEDSCTSQLINRKRGMLPKTKIPTSDEKIDLTPGSGLTDSSSTEFVKRKRGKPPKNKNVKTSSNEHSESPSYIKEASNFNDLKISQQSMKFLKSINPTSNGAFLYKSVTRASSVNLAGDSSSTNLPSTSRAHVTKTECSIQVANTVVNFNPVVKLVNCMLDPSVSQSIILSRSMQTSKNKNVCIPDEQILTVSSSPIKHRNGDMNSISDDSPSTSSNVRINTHFDDHLKSSSRKTRGLSPESSVKQKREMRGTPGAKTSTSGPKVSSSSRSSNSSGETINMQTKNNSLLEHLTPLEMGSDSIYYLDDIPLDEDKLEDTTLPLQLSGSQKKQISNFVTLSFEIQAPNRKGIYKNKPGWVEHYIKDNYKWEAVQFQNMSEELDQLIKREERILEEMEKFVENYGK